MLLSLLHKLLVSYVVCNLSWEIDVNLQPSEVMSSITPSLNSDLFQRLLVSKRRKSAFIDPGSIPSGKGGQDYPDPHWIPSLQRDTLFDQRLLRYGH